MSSVTTYHYLIVDISSDEQKNFAQSTAVKILLLNMIEAPNMSAESTKTTQGSEKSHNETGCTFNSEASPRMFGVDIFPEKITPQKNSEVFVVESHVSWNSESSYYEEPETLRPLPSSSLPRHREKLRNCP